MSDKESALARRRPRGLRSQRLRLGDETFVVFSYPLPSSPTAGDPWSRLTPAEREVLRAVLRGDRSTAIAAQRGTSPATVNKQIETAYRKLGVSSRAELAARFADRD